MGHCEICNKETSDSAEIYQADFVSSSTTTSQSKNIFEETTTTRTVKKYTNVARLIRYCCKDCRKTTGSPLVLFILALVCSGLLALCIWAGPWNPPIIVHIPISQAFLMKLVGNLIGILEIVSVIGVFVFGFLALILFSYTIISLFRPVSYSSVESAVLKHLNKPENSKGHVYMTKKEGSRLK